MTTRAERAQLIPEEDIIFTGNLNFMVLSQSQQTSYKIDLATGKCTCPDAERGYTCKHQLAARFWLENNSIYQRAKAVVTNNAIWQNGSMRTLYKKAGSCVYVRESHGLLWLHVVRDLEERKVQCGMLTYTNLASPWTFLLTKQEYNRVQ